MEEIKLKVSIKTKNYKKIYLSIKPDIGSRKNLKERIYIRNKTIIYEVCGKISHAKAAINTLISLIEMLKQVDKNDTNPR